MPAERRAHRCRNLVHCKLAHRFLEHRDRVAGIQPAKIAALGRTRVLGVELRHVLEFRAAFEPILEAIDLGLGIGFGRDFIDANQDVPHVRLIDQRLVVMTAAVDQLDNMKSGGAAQHRRHVARLHCADGFREHRRQTRPGTPAEIAAGQRVARIGKPCGDLPEVRAVADILQRLFGAAPLGLDLLRARLLRNQDEDMCETVFRFSSKLRLGRGEVIFDLGIAHRDAGIDLALAQPLHDDLAAHVLAVPDVRDPVSGERLAKPVERELVVFGDALDCALDLGVVDLDAAVLGVLQQGTFGDQALEHLLIEDVGRRLLHILLFQLLHDDAFGVVELVLRDGLVVDHRDDAIDSNYAWRGRARYRRRWLRRGGGRGQPKHDNKQRADEHYA